MDTIMPSASNYKVNVQINSLTLDDCSFVTSSDTIRPFFEDSVSNDQDVTGLMVFLKNSGGSVIGNRVLYSLVQENADDPDAASDDVVILVKNLDDFMPSFPMPKNLQPAMYTMVTQVMNGKNVLQRVEKSFYYINSIDFAYKGISVYLPGVTESSQLIPKGTVVMLETNIDFTDSIDPYIVWYEGKNIINEGKYSNGAGQLFWKAPEQSGFFYLRAEVFPVKTGDKLAGYKKDISLLVSSIAIDVHMVLNNIHQLVHWYTLDGSLNDSKMIASAERALKPADRASPVWKGKNGTYGLLTGYENTVSLPKVRIPEGNTAKTWQALFRFNSVNDGELFSVSFGSSGVRMHLFKENTDIILTITSPSKTVSQNYSLPEKSNEPGYADSYIAAGLNFSVLSESISAHVNILGDLSGSDLNKDPAVIDISFPDEFQFLLGQTDSDIRNDENKAKVKSAVIWDEFALYYMPPPDFFSAAQKR